jgi:fatty-acyl-CoA synthase
MPEVAEAAVVGLAHPRWDERPLAVVVLRQGHVCSSDAVRAYLATRFPKWWLPDCVEFVSSIPKTSVGKFQKREIRERYHDLYKTAAAPSIQSGSGTSAKIAAEGR